MLKITRLCALLLTTLIGAAHAAPQHGSDAARYDDARSQCEQERNQGQRKKCLREAERRHAPAGNKQAKASCQDCGKVLGVRMAEHDGKSNALGVIGGGAAGALLGNQVGSGSGKTLATIAGAVGGAYAGKKLQEKANATKVWTVDVEYDNGRRGSFTFDHDPGLQRGDRVKHAGQSLTRI